MTSNNPLRGALRLVEAKKTPNPSNFVPVFDWDSSRIWLWVQKPGEKVIGPVEMLHADVSKYAGKLGWLPQVMEYRAQLDPQAYSSPVDLFPSTWVVGDPAPGGEPKKVTTKGKYSPPGTLATVSKISLPSEFHLTGSKDPNGFSTAEDAGSGEVYSVLPEGQFGKWVAEEGVYYIVKKEDGEWDVHLDSPLYTPSELKKKVETELPSVPSEFVLPPNHSVVKSTPSFVQVATPDGTEVKWIKVTDHWVYAKDPTKEYTPLQPAGGVPAPQAVGKAKGKSKAKAKGQKGSLAIGAPSAPEPKAEPVISSDPEPSPHLTKYVGKVDVNGFPLVNEVGEGDPEDDDVAWGLTLLPDERVARWRPQEGLYLLYDYHPHFGFMHSKKGETITVGEVKALMGVLSLTVKSAMYHKVSFVGNTPAEVPSYKVPVPPHTEEVEGKTDTHGLQVVKTIPASKEDDTSWELSLLPNGVVTKWEPLVKKYQVWEWGSIMGFYNYYPVHPSKYISLKEVKKLQAQSQASAGAVTPVSTAQATGALPDTSASAPPPTTAAPVISTTPPPGMVPTPSAGLGVLNPTGKKDAKGFDLGMYGGTFSMLPDGKVGVWSEANGAYVLYKYDSLADSYYNAMTLWTPPGHHKSLANQVKRWGDVAALADHLGTEVIVLPNGQFAQFSYSHGGYDIYKVEPYQSNVFVSTGQNVAKSTIAKLFKTPEAKSMVPTGSVDVNGLPLFSVNKGTRNLSMLPDGRLAYWNASTQVGVGSSYRVFEFFPDDGIWATSTIPMWVWLSDLPGMYLKAGAEPVDETDDDDSLPPEVVATAPTALVVTLHHTLTDAHQKDVNGYPIVDINLPSQAGMRLSVLPDGSYGLLKAKGAEYWKMWFDITDGQWSLGSTASTSEPIEKISLDTVKTLGLPPSLQPALASAGAGLSVAMVVTVHPSLTIMDQVDPNGFPRVKVTAYPVFKFSVLPNGVYAQIHSETSKYRQVEFEDTVGTWKIKKPETAWTGEEAAKLGVPPILKSSGDQSVISPASTPAAAPTLKSPADQSVDPTASTSPALVVTVDSSVTIEDKLDPNGYPTVKIKTIGYTMSVLPNGVYAKLVPWWISSDNQSAYKVMIHGPKGWSDADPVQLVLTDEAAAMGPPPILRYLSSATSTSGGMVVIVHPSLNILNQNDPNGYPQVQLKDSIQTMSVLPNGAYVQMPPWLNAYRQLVFDEDEESWVVADPMETWTAEEAVEMGPPPILKVVGETIADAGTSTVVKRLHPTLKFTGGVDQNGYLTVVPLGDPDTVMTALPNGEYAVWGAYDKYWKYNLEDVKDETGEKIWVESEPEVSWTLDQVKAMGPAVAPSHYTPTSAVSSALKNQSVSPAVVQPPEATSSVPLTAGKLPSPGDLKHVGSGKALGYAGQGDKEIFEDPKTGKKYIFKLAALKGGKSTALFKVASQQGFSTIASFARPDAYVPVEVSEYEGKSGTIQLELPTKPGQGTLSGVAPTSLTPQQKTDVASEHLLDWLMSQHDSFGSNLIVTAEGRVVGVDKEQGWRFFEGAAKGGDTLYHDRLSTDYAPNSSLHGEQPPYYNKFWKAFSEGSMDFDPKTMVPTLQKIESIPVGVLEKVAEDYLASRSDMSGPKKTYERYRFVKKILSRRATLRADFEKFLTEHYEERTKEAGKFTFSKGWIPIGDGGPKWQEVELPIRDLALQLLGSTALKPHKTNPEWVLLRVPHLTPITKIQEFLKEMGVEAVDTSPDPNPIFGSTYNSIVVKSADLNVVVKKQVEIKQDASQKYQDHSGVPTYFPACEALTEAPGNVEGLKIAHQMWLGPLGKNFTLDADAVEQQTASIQRIKIVGGETYYVAHFKLREPYWKSLTGWVDGHYGWPIGSYDEEEDALIVSPSSGTSTDQSAKLYSGAGNDQIAILTSQEAWAFRGSVYAKIHGQDINVYSRLKSLLAKAGLDAKVMKNPSAEDIELYNMAQALWCLAPQKHRKLSANDLKDPEKLKKSLKGVLTKDQLAALRQVDGTVSRGSPILPGMWKTLGGGTPESPIVRFVFWTVDKDSVPKILKSAAVGVHERLRMGLGLSGSSAWSDVSSGGADMTTMRLATVNSAGFGVTGIGSVHYPVALIIAPEVLDRLDISLHSSDTFGCSNDLWSGGNATKWVHRQGMSEAVKTFNNGDDYVHKGSTELVIRRGVPAKLIKRVVTSGESDRKRILELCENEGITEHFGCPIEDFVVVEHEQGVIYTKYLKPLGY